MATVTGKTFLISKDFLLLSVRGLFKVSGLTTVRDVDKAYPNCLQHTCSSLPQLHTSPNFSATVGNILRTHLSGFFFIVSSLNFV